MSNMRLTVETLTKRVSDFLGDTNNTVPTGDKLTLAKDIVERGLRRFIYTINLSTGDVHEWSFLKEYYTLKLVATKWQYSLPANFSEILTDPVYGDEDSLQKLSKIPPEQLLGLRVGQLSEFPPALYSIVPYGAGATTGQYDEIWFYPIPEASYDLKFWIKIDPLKPDAATEILPGGVKAAEAIIEHCLAVADEQENEKIGIHAALADKLTQQLIVVDSQRDNRTLLGNLGTGVVRTVQYRNMDGTDSALWYMGE